MDEPEESSSKNDGENPKVLLEPNSDTDSLSAEPEEVIGSTISGAVSTPGASSPGPVKNGPNIFRRTVSRLNIYLIMYMVILLLAAGIIAFSYINSNKNSNASSNLKTQSLNQSTLDQLANSDATVGSSQQVLTVQSNAIFSGQVLIRNDLEIAGNLKLGSTAAFGNITASGTSQFATVVVNQKLSVAGDTALQGSATIAKNLQVNGSGTFNGALSAPQITTSSLQLSGDLTLNHHIVTGGASPSRSGGSALGGGGTASINGSDTAGTININTGSSPSSGCFVTVNFTSKFANTPHVQVTPIGSAAAGLAYYVNRSNTNFSVCTASSAPASAAFSFDYFVID